MRDPLQADRLRQRRPTLADIRESLRQRRQPRRGTPINLEELRARQLNREFQPPPAQPQVQTTPHQQPALTPEAAEQYRLLEEQHEEQRDEERKGILGGILNLVEMYDRNVNQPIAGLALGAALSGPLRWTEAGKTFADEWEKSRQDGRATNIWEQSRAAYEATDTPWGVKFWTEVLADPLNFIGGAGKGVKFGAKGLAMIARGQSAEAADAIAKGLGKVGQTVGNVPSNVSQSGQNIIERTSNLLRGGKYRTAKEEFDMMKAADSEQTPDQIAGVDKASFTDKAREQLHTINFMDRSILLDPDRKWWNAVKARLEELTGQKEAGGVRGESARLTMEDVVKNASVSFDELVRQNPLGADSLELLKSKFSISDIPQLAKMPDWQVQEIAEEAVGKRVARELNTRGDLIDAVIFATPEHQTSKEALLITDPAQRWARYEQFTDAELRDLLIGKELGDILRLRNAGEAIDLYKKELRHKTQQGWIFDWRMMDARWSPLYWFFRGTSIAADKVFMRKSMFKDDSRLLREMYNAESTRGTNQGLLLTKQFGSFLTEEGKIVPFWENIDGVNPVNLLGRAIKGRKSVFDDPTAREQGNLVADELRQIVEESLDTEDIPYLIDESGNLIVDDVVTTGSTVFDWLAKNGEARGLVVALAHKLKPKDYDTVRRLDQSMRVANDDPNRTVRTFGDMFKSRNNRGIRGDTERERLRHLMSREPDYSFERGPLSFDLYLLGDASNPTTTIYGTDDVFGVRLRWSEFGGKTMEGTFDPQDVDSVELLRKVASYGGKSGALFRGTVEGTVVNLRGIQVTDLRYPLHSIEAIKQRYHARWLQQRAEQDFYATNSYMAHKRDYTKNYKFERPRNLDGEQLESLDTHDIEDLLSADQKRGLERLFRQNDHFVSYMWNSKAFETGDFEVLNGYLHRSAIAKTRRGEDAPSSFKDDMVFKDRGANAFGKMSLEEPRSGALYDNLEAGVIYDTPAEDMGNFQQQVTEMVSRQRLSAGLKMDMVFNASADLFAKMHKQVALQGMMTFARNFADEMKNEKSRQTLLENQSEIYRLLFAMKRLNEAVGVRDSQITEADRRYLEKLGYDAMDGMERLLDQITAPSTGRRYRLQYEGQEPKRDVRDFSSPERLNRLKSHLIGVVKPLKQAKDVWVPTMDSTRGATVYRKLTLRTHDDVDDLIESLRDAPGGLEKRLWLTDPRSVDRTYYDLMGDKSYQARRGRYEGYVHDRGGVKAADLKSGAMSDIQIRHRREAVRSIRLFVSATTDARFENDLDGAIDELRGQLVEATRRSRYGDRNAPDWVDKSTDKWLQDIVGDLKDNDIDLPQDLIDDLRTWRSDVRGSAGQHLALGLNRELEDIARSARRVKTGVYRKKYIQDRLNEMEAHTEREAVARQSQVMEAIEKFMEILGDEDNVKFANKEYWRKTGTLAHNIEIAKRLTADAAGVKASGRFDKSTLSDRPLFGTRPGSRVTGTHYDRSGARNPIADVRDMLEHREFKKVPGVGGAMVQYEDALYKAYGVDKDRIPWLASTGYMFTENGKRQIEKLAANPHSKLWKVTDSLDWANSIMRWANVGFDAGGWMIQGLSVLSVRPDIFAASVMRSIPVLADPQHLDDYMLMHFDDLWEMAQHGTLLRTSRMEDFRLLSRVQALRGTGEALRTTNYPGAGVFDAAEREARIMNPPLGAGYGATRGGTSPATMRARDTVRGSGMLLLDVANRAEAFYNATMVARHMLWRSWKDPWVRFGGTLEGLAEQLNYMTGFVDLSARGMTQMQQDFERNWLFFSTHYTRSSMALVGSMFKGGVQGAAATATLASTIAAPTIYYWAIANAMGQEPLMDPRPVSEGGDGSRAFTIELAGNRVGVGTIWTQLVRLFGSVTEKAANDPLSFASPDVRENDVLRFFRNRIPPVPNAIDDVIRGLYNQPVYLGERLENVGDWAQQTTGRVVPFALDTTFLQQRVNMNTFIGGMTELTGLRTFPVSTWDKLQVIRDSIAREEFDKRWLSLDRRQQQYLKDQNPTLVELQDQIGIERLARSYGVERDFGVLLDIRYELKRSADRQFKQQMTEANEALGNEVIDTTQYRQLLKDAWSDRRARMSSQDDPLFDEVNQMLAEQLADRASNRENLQPAHDLAYAEFIFTVTGVGDHGTYTDFDAQTEARRAFRRKWGDEVYNYINQTWIESLENVDWKYPDAMREYYWGRQNYEWYWNELTDAVVNSSSNPTEARVLYDQWELVDPTEKSAMEANSELLAKVLKTRRILRRMKREENRDLDIWLYRWGYTDNLMHPDNQWDGALGEYRYGILTGPPYPLIDTVEIER